MRRMRTINEAFKHIKESDNDTAITSNYIRQLCKSNKIYCIMAGTKYLLDLDELIKYLCGN